MEAIPLFLDPDDKYSSFTGRNTISYINIADCKCVETTEIIVNEILSGE